jgi:hypothetical protein
MGEVKSIADLLKNLGVSPQIADAVQNLGVAMVSSGHDMIDKNPDDSLWGALESIQRVMDLCDVMRRTLLECGIHNPCAKMVTSGYEHPAAASVAQIGRQFQHAMLDLTEMLGMKTPVDLLDRIKAAHGPKEETDGEGEGKAPVQSEGCADEDSAADPAPVADDE